MCVPGLTIVPHSRASADQSFASISNHSGMYSSRSPSNREKYSRLSRSFSDRSKNGRHLKTSQANRLSNESERKTNAAPRIVESIRNDSLMVTSSGEEDEKA